MDAGLLLGLLSPLHALHSLAENMTAQSASKVSSWQTAPNSLTPSPLSRCFLVSIPRTEPPHHLICSELPVSQNNKYTNCFSVGDSLVPFPRCFAWRDSHQECNPLSHAVFQGFMAQGFESQRRRLTRIWILAQKIFCVPSSAGKPSIVTMPLRENEGPTIFWCTWNRDV